MTQLFSFPRSRFLLFLCLLLSPPSWVWAADWKASREKLDHQRVVGNIRVFYTLEGEHAFPIDAPKQASRAEALIEQIFQQFDQANVFYSNTLGLVPPFKNARYRDVRWIDVHIMKIDGMGKTGDAIARFRYRNRDFNAPGTSISIVLANRWAPPNTTPNHELFHAYQYGYTFFKTSWFLEGLARSMDDVFSNRVNVKPLPQSKQELNELMKRSYRASAVWNRVMQLCDPACKVNPTNTKLPQLCGGSIIRPLLENYQALDRVAAKDRRLDPNDWPEEEQRSEKNNPYLLQGLRRVLESHCPLNKSSELKSFHQLLGE